MKTKALNVNACSSRGDGCVTVPDPLVAPLRDSHYLINLIAELTQQPRQQVADRFLQEHQRLGTNVATAMRHRRVEPFRWSEQMMELYRESDAFIFETLAWNRTDAKCQMRKWIAQFLANNLRQPARILIYGDGSGVDTLYFTLAGHDVTYFDVSRKSTQLARTIFLNNGVSPTILSSTSQLVDQSYDTVICLDVLEHAPDPPRLVSTLARALREEGNLIVHAPFFCLSTEFSTHLRSNLVFSGNLSRLYTPSGLSPVDARLIWSPLVLEKSSHPDRTRRPGWGKRIRIRAGQFLLCTARLWTMPHIQVAKIFARYQQKRLAGYHSSITAR